MSRALFWALGHCCGQDRPGSLNHGLLVGATDAGGGDMDAKQPDTLKSKCVAQYM